MATFKFRPIEKESTTKEKVYNQIKQVILNGQITADEIFTELKLAEHLNTSRTPVREALQDLLKEGLIVSIPRKGLAVRKVSRNEVEQIFLLRKSIEREVVFKLSGTFTEKQYAELKDLCSKQEMAMKDNDEVAFIHLDQQFHLALTEFAGYDLIRDILLNLHNLSHLIGLQALKKANRMSEVLEEHLSIIEALKARDAELAARRMTEHLLATNESIIINEKE